MTIAFVLGNGVSRKSVKLDELQPLGTIYGCNALYREFTPHCLVATDAPIARAIQESGYSKTARFHTRRPLPGFGALDIPKKYFGNSSGPIACALAALDNHHKIYMLGFDMGPNNQQFNNVYAGTEFYKPVNATPTYTGNWVKQIKQVAQDFPNVWFIRVQGPTTADIAELTRMSNIKHTSIDAFLQQVQLSTL